MDTLGALALATEPPTDHLMKRSPVGRRLEFVGLLFMQYYLQIRSLIHLQSDVQLIRLSLVIGDASDIQHPYFMLFDMVNGHKLDGRLKLIFKLA